MNKKFPSELRFDKISKDWVIIATDREKRPRALKKKRNNLKKDCPFCHPQKNKEPVFILSNKKEIPFTSWKKIKNKWTTLVIPNKYPALVPGKKLNKKNQGNFYEKMNAIGFHEVVITKSHTKHIAKLSIKKVEELFDVFQKRYLALKNKEFVNHISIFHNHGEKAGATIFHPHSQIITTPLIDVDLKKALSNAKKYFQKEKKCIYCKMNEWEKRKKERVVFENKDFLAICPFASKTAFQVIVSPKKHQPYFEKETKKANLAEAFQSVMKKIDKALNNPDYNFYLHTAPCDGKKHDYYHYHWTILPKTSIRAGFEMGTQMEISTIEPEKAAKYLKSN